MKWWQKLKRNSLARFGIAILLLFYLVAIAANFVAPYDPYVSQKDASLLPPTPIHWRDRDGNWTAPFVYPIAKGATDLATGDQKVVEDTSQPSPIRLFVKGDPYDWVHIYWDRSSDVKKEDLPEDLHPFVQKKRYTLLRVSWDRHLFGTEGEGRIHLLGTDEQARDAFSRLAYGSRISLSIGLVGIAVSFPIGAIVGGISGYFGGWADSLIMRFTEVLMTIPGIYLLVALAAILPPGLSSTQRFVLIVLITSLIRWAGLARVVRGQVLSIKEREFVRAARAMGARSFHIILRHVLPQTSTYVIISATLAIPGYIVAESVLSLIGLGIQEPDPSWGNLLSAATNASIMVLQPWLVFPPALAIVLTVLSFNLLGDSLRDALDPRSLR